MKALPHMPELLSVATRVIWFEPPEQALANGPRFFAYLMTYGTADDIATVRKYVDENDFMGALDTVPAGILDARSWAYWNAMDNRYPTPPMPQRLIPA
jgi:hypothetical protein